uniref:Zinc finger homeobox protein 3 n=1 Tax=Lygus hesperus TaxID=30085 RepID=A0A0A9Y9T1_LYGHE
MHSKIFVKRGKPFKTVLSSRFCTGNLLIVFNDVLNNTTPVISYDFWAESSTSFFTSSSSMNCLAYNEFKMVDVRDKPWISDYHIAQTESLRALCPVLVELKKGSNFVFVGLPLLTQFNVGLVFLLARNFKKVGFPYPRELGNCIVFQDLQSTDFSDLLDVLKEDVQNLALISLVDITALGDEYLKTVTLFNQVLLRKTSLVMAHNL